MSAVPLSWSQVVEIVVSLLAAYVFALPLGWERKAKGTTHVGLRTFPLVSVGTCGYLLLARHLQEAGVYSADGLARTLRAMMTGIGFIGGGAILKRTPAAHGVGGIATGASIWTTGAIGVAVALGYFEIALVLCVASLLILDASDRIAARRATRRAASPSARPSARAGAAGGAPAGAGGAGARSRTAPRGRAPRRSRRR